MANRTLVKVYASDDCISFRTISYRGKSCQRFIFRRKEIESLTDKSQLISNDINSFAVVQRGTLVGGLDIVRIEFSWLYESGGKLIGERELVRLPYDAFIRFVSGSKDDEACRKWKCLSLEETNDPMFVFNSHRALHEILADKVVRHKLVQFLQENFHWCNYDRIEFTDDFLPYSFFFRSFSPRGEGICGGLILHNQEDMTKAYYSVHT